MRKDRKHILPWSDAATASNKRCVAGSGTQGDLTFVSCADFGPEKPSKQSQNRSDLVKVDTMLIYH